MLKMDKKENSKADAKTTTLLLLCVIGILLGILLEIINVAVDSNEVKIEKNKALRSKYYVLSKSLDAGSTNGCLTHVHSVLRKIGYLNVTDESKWDLMWSLNYNFHEIKDRLLNLKPNQKVNQFPGTECITNKILLGFTNSKYVPRIFELPNKRHEFINYTKYSPQSFFLEKKINNSGCTLKHLKDIDFNSGQSYVQEYIQKPFLVDGHKFEIGVYVVITSVNPLRAYWYKGEVLFRFCPTKYYPFNYNNTSGYILPSKYLSIWHLPSLTLYYTMLGHSMKDTFDNYVESQGKESSLVWHNVQKAIAEILYMKERHLVAAVQHYPSKDNFFEMMRFDFLVNQSLDVHLLKVKKAPETDSAGSFENPLLYKQLLYSLFSLTGISRKLTIIGNSIVEKIAAQNMVSSQKHISVFGQECRTATCKDDCNAQQVCQLCKPCLDKMLSNNFLKAHTEHLYRGNFRRVVPPPMYKLEDTTLIEHITYRKNLSTMNRLQHIWYQGKCNQDLSWCT